MFSVFGCDLLFVHVFVFFVFVIILLGLCMFFIVFSVLHSSCFVDGSSSFVSGFFFNVWAVTGSYTALFFGSVRGG